MPHTYPEFNPSDLETEIQYARDRGDNEGAEELEENQREMQEQESIDAAQPQQ